MRFPSIVAAPPGYILINDALLRLWKTALADDVDIEEQDEKIMGSISDRLLQSLRGGELKAFVAQETKVTSLPAIYWKKNPGWKPPPTDNNLFVSNVGDNAVLYPAPGGFPICLSEREFSKVVGLLAFAQPTPATNRGISPFLQYMLEATTALNLSPDIRTPKKIIEKWLEKNWRPDVLGSPDKSKISYMATFIRAPLHTKGGNLPMVKNSNSKKSEGRKG
jgi:hypothetical protein